MLNKKALAATAAAAEPVYVEDVFSTYLYTGTGSSQTITNGVDLAGEGGLVWIKSRNTTIGHALFDTNNAALDTSYYPFLVTNTTEQIRRANKSGSMFSSTGFSVGRTADGTEDDYFFLNGTNYASWTFRKAEKFFDVVTYTGNGSNRTISHNLGSIPGCIIVKRTDTTGAWQVYHRSLANTEYMVLNTTAAKATGTTRWNSTTPTSTVFSLGTDATVNASGGTYVAYLFAHDAGGFGDAGDQSVIKCGGYTGNGSSVLVDLGWEPQWLLIRESSGAANWHIFDNMRGVSTGGNDTFLYANTTAADNTANNYLSFNATGFTPDGADNLFRQSGVSYIYIAIRRGPMKTPESGTSVFSADTNTSTPSSYFYNPGFPPDFAMSSYRAYGPPFYVGSRLQGNIPYLQTTSSASEYTASTPWKFDTPTNQFQQYVVGGGSANIITYMFRRAPGFFDVVCYSGNNVNSRVFNHNLGVAPEMIILKQRTSGSYATENWITWTPAIQTDDFIYLNRDSAIEDYFYDWATTATTFRPGGSYEYSNVTGQNYVAYLFASCPGVSKVGSYTGTGTTLQVNCGFTSGSRFVLIKRTDSTGDWYVWDSARGIVAGNDPYLLLNSTAAEVTNTDYIDTYSSGFEITSTAPAAINANGGTYIYLAIA